MKIRKAVIPAAGFGSRFLPAVKAIPKELLPIVDKPVIQYVVEELVDAGITDIFIVTSQNKTSIEDHFDSPSAGLLKNLEEGKKFELIDQVEKIGKMSNFVYLRQKGPYGNGTPLLNVRHLINEPFIYCWSDGFVSASPISPTKQLINTYEKYGCSVLDGVRIKNDDDYTRYGFAGGEEIEPGIIDTKEIIEKPGKENSPSNLANVSSFLFTPDIFDYLDPAVKNLKPGNELYYNDILRLMLADGKQILTKEIENGEYYDCGSVLRYLKTNVEFALKRSDIGEDFRKYLEEITRS